jgi:hypothetical protein
MARALGGGGHILAAGARLPDVDVAQAVALLAEHTRIVLGLPAAGPRAGELTTTSAAL